MKSIITAQVHPKSGIVEPGQTVPLTLILTSDSSPTFLSFSIPCDIINYSKLKYYESVNFFRNYFNGKSKECFTITEKGTTFEVIITKKFFNS